MGLPILVIGKSGSGKSTSLRNFGEDEILLINVGKKPLPFKKRFTHTINTDDYSVVGKALQQLGDIKTVVIDDAGYLITNMFMRGHSSKGAGNAIFGFYNDMADRFWRMIEYIKSLDEHVVIYIIMHEAVDDNGNVGPKTIGRLLDEKVCLEGLFTIVLRCITEDGKHYFKTATDGSDVAKAPMDMFEKDLIDNDLKAVNETIRNYYNI